MIAEQLQDESLSRCVVSVGLFASIVDARSPFGFKLIDGLIELIETRTAAQQFLHRSDRYSILVQLVEDARCFPDDDRSFQSIGECGFEVEAVSPGWCEMTSSISDFSPN